MGEQGSESGQFQSEGLGQDTLGGFGRFTEADEMNDLERLIHPLMDPGYQSGLGTGPLMIGGQVFPGHPVAQEFNYYEQGPPGTYLAAGAGGPLASTIFKSFPLMPGLTKAAEPMYPNFITSAIKRFGTTENPYNSGYILPKGEMLDFGGGSKWRNIDHVQINDVAQSHGGWPKIKEYYGEVAAPDRFTDITNSMRMNLQPGGGPLWISFTKVPTKDQLRTIKDIIPYVEMNKHKYPNLPTITADLVNLKEPTRPRTASSSFENYGDFVRWLETKFGDYR